MPASAPMRPRRLSLEAEPAPAGAEYTAIARGSHEPWRLGAATAMAVEDSLRRTGWPEGAVCESEDAMAAKFGVGVRVMRQALRILEARGACRLQRGRSGGLVVLRPDLDRAASALANGLIWSGASMAEVVDACEVLEPMIALALVGRPLANHAAVLVALEAHNPGLALAHACLQSLPGVATAELAMDDRPAHGMIAHEGPRHNLAETVAHRIGQGITHERLRAQERLGSLWDLAGQHGVSLAVATDAIRILEDADLVSCVKGRSGGVTLKLPGGDAVVSVVHGYLAAAGMTEAQCIAICHALNVRAACKAAEQRRAVTLAVMDEIFVRMRRAQGEAVMQAWYELQKLLHDEAGNRPLHLLTRCLAAYCVRIAAIDTLPSLPPHFLERMVLTTEQTVRAIHAGDVAGTAAGQCATRAVLDERGPPGP